MLYEVVDWIHLAQGREQWYAAGTTVMTTLLACSTVIFLPVGVLLSYQKLLRLLDSFSLTC
jgi:hypothetical protein